MLSPNARNRVFEIFGGTVTVTLKLQDPWRVRLSVAVHVTTVEPGANAVPDGLEQITATGGSPPTTAGVLKMIGIAAPSGETTAIGAGHSNDGASAIGFGGVGDEQAPNAITHKRTTGSLGTNHRLVGRWDDIRDAVPAGVMSSRWRMAAKKVSPISRSPSPFG